LVLIDRYYYDFFIDQRRYRLRVPQWIVRAGLTFLKKPDLVFILDAPEQALQQRKQEVKPEESRRQREAYLRMGKSLPNAHIIDAGQNVPEVVRDIKRAILRFMAERAERG
jgi:thymidylate kinase